jgi:ABC-2 type transport system ATP-binding protein
MASIISACDLVKVYQSPRKAPGLAASLRSLFRREYDEVRAVDGVSFEIEPGERVAFLGPNGAGKTTTLKMLAGLLVPSGGQLQVAGHRPAERRADFLESITLVMGQKQQLRWDLPPTETFALNRALFGLEEAAWQRTVDELVELLELGPLLQRPVRNLSLGERMKCELAAALLHRPQLLFLDEPTIGLDARMQVLVRQFIERWNRQTGATVLLTSHYMADVQALCDRVIIIAEGRLRYDGRLRSLVEEMAPERRVVVRTWRPPSAAELAAAVGFEEREGQLVASVSPAQVREALDRAYTHLPVQDLTIEEPPLEEVIRRLYGEGRAA